MRRLIDKAELMRHIENEMREWGEEYDALQILGDIEDFPTIDPVKHGHWISHGSFYTCSVCDEEQYGIDTGRFYCQNCGAKMEGVKNETD